MAVATRPRTSGASAGSIILGVIRRHPVPTYFALTFAISSGGVLLAVGPGGLPATLDQRTLVGLTMLGGPAIAGLLLIGLVDGRAGYRELVCRLLTWRVSWRWYTVALLTTPLPSRFPGAACRAFTARPAWTWCLIRGQDLAHLLHRLQKPLFQLWRERHLLLCAACEQHHAMRGPGVPRVFENRALRGHLEHVRWPDTTCVRLLLERDPRAVRLENVVWPSDESESL
jgi:hypothetical protein